MAATFEEGKETAAAFRYRPEGDRGDSLDRLKRHARRLGIRAESGYQMTQTGVLDALLDFVSGADQNTLTEIFRAHLAKRQEDGTKGNGSSEEAENATAKAKSSTTGRRCPPSRVVQVNRLVMR